MKNILLKKNPFKYRLCIYLMVVASVLLTIAGGFAAAPASIKLLYALFCYGSILAFPYLRLMNRNAQFSKIGYILIVLLLCLGLLAIIKSLFSDDPLLLKFGNKYLTLFGNENTSLIFIPPLYALLVTYHNSLKILKNATIVFLCICFLNFVIFQRTYWLIACFSFLFYPYIKLKEQLLLYLFLPILFYLGIAGDGRICLIVMILSYGGLYLVYTIKNKFLINLCCWTMVAFPIIMLTYSIFNHQSFFELASQLISNENIKEDTRTFLYTELANDLSKNDAWIMGKGASSRYYSPYFMFNEGDSAYRAGSEVPILNFLLKGGLVYVVVYLITFILAIHRALKHGKSQFMQCIAFILSEWIMVSFVGDINGSGYVHLSIWMLVGCCYSKRILKYSNNDIKKLLK